MKSSNLFYCRNLARLFVIAILFTSPIMAIWVNVTSSSPTTYLFVDPPEVRDVQPNETFSIKINVSDAPPTAAWEVILNWDRTVLNVTGIEQGDFLHRWYEDPFEPGVWYWKYPTSWAYTPLNKANDTGQMLITCALAGEFPMDEWASGNGWLATLNFTVKTTGSTLLNLFGTRLWDHIVGGYPASTAYPNYDGFFYNLAQPTHDIGIFKVTPLPLTAIRGTTVNIDVIVLNEGTETESITLNVKANDTLIGTTSLSLGTGNLESRSYTYTVTWSTAGLAFGEYNITASVPAVTGEVDTADNFLIVGIVKVMLHDIAVTNVITNATTVKIGEIVSINATVVNEGSEFGNFNVTAYYDDFPIETQTISSFAPSSQINLTFTWNTIFVSADIYTIKVNATSTTDTNTTNNVFTDGDVTVYREFGWPIANFTYSPLKPVTNQTITFTSTSYDEDGYIENWAWDFNDDGNTDARTAVATWNYTVSGNHKVRLTVNDNDPLTPPQGIEKMITVYPRPIAKFTYSPENPTINELVTFDASASYDPDGGTIVDYSWDFGDDQTDNGETVSHRYTSFGNHTVTLNVTDNDGIKGTKSLKLYVREVPSASFTFSPSSPLVYQAITFNASSSTPNGGSITKYSWDFGDGTLSADETDPITSHTYTLADTYTVTLNVTDSEGLNSTTTQSVVVGRLSSTTSINVAPSSITRGESVTITGSITPERKGVNVTIWYKLREVETWTLLDTLTTNDNSQYSHDWTPTAAGTYEIKARWEGDANTIGDESDTKTITVQETSIIPDSTLLLIAGIIIVIAVAVAVYFLKFRKQKTQQGPPANSS